MCVFISRHPVRCFNFFVLCQSPLWDLNSGGLVQCCSRKILRKSQLLLTFCFKSGGGGLIMVSQNSGPPALPLTWALYVIWFSRHTIVETLSIYPKIQELIFFKYYHVSNKRGGWNKSGGWQNLEICNVEAGINVEGRQNLENQ